MNDYIKDASVSTEKHTNTYTIGEEWLNQLDLIGLIYNTVLPSGV